MVYKYNHSRCTGSPLACVLTFLDILLILAGLVGSGLFFIICMVIPCWFETIKCCLHFRNWVEKWKERKGQERNWQRFRTFFQVKFQTSHTHTLSLSLSVSILTATFPGEPGLAGTRISVQFSSPGFSGWTVSDHKPLLYLYLINVMLSAQHFRTMRR